MGTFHSGTLYNLFLLRNQFGDIGCPQMERPQIATLEKRIVMAKSSMVASTIPKSQIYHGNRDAYVPKPLFDN